MKKWTVLFLAATMIFSFAACGGKEEPAETPVQKVEETETEEAAEAETPKSEEQKTEEGGKEPGEVIKRNGVSEADCLGTWINTVPGHYRELTVLLEKNGTGMVYFLGKEAPLTWELDRDLVRVYTELPNNLALSIEKNDETIVLKNKDKYAMISEAEYNTLYETVEITKDNWNNYFDVETVVDDMGALYVGKALVLKDEYVGRCGRTNITLDVNMGEYKAYAVECNTETGEINFVKAYTDAEMKAMYPRHYYVSNAPDEKGTAQVSTKYVEKQTSLTTYTGAYGDYVTDGNIVRFDTAVFDKVEILNASGTLELLK